MKKIGLITIGQSPRDDVLVDIIPLFSDDIELLQAGALDGLSEQDIATLAPGPGDYVLISKLQNGHSAVFAEKYVLPRLQQCIKQLESRGAELILFLCTGSFPPFESHVPLVFPCKVLNGIVPALTKHSSIAVMTPKEEQRVQCIDKWKKYVDKVQVVAASPYGDISEIECAAKAIAGMEADIVILDCIGYTVAMKKLVREVSGKQVILSRTIAVRAVMELLS